MRSNRMIIGMRVCLHATRARGCLRDLPTARSKTNGSALKQQLGYVMLSTSLTPNSSRLTTTNRSRIFKSFAKGCPRTRTPKATTMPNPALPAAPPPPPILSRKSTSNLPQQKQQRSGIASDLFLPHQVAFSHNVSQPLAFPFAFPSPPPPPLSSPSPSH